MLINRKCSSQLHVAKAHVPVSSYSRVAMSLLDWKLCVICQTKSSEELCCPTRSALDVKRPPMDIYSTFLSNVEEFQKLGSLPVKVNFGDQGTAQIFLVNDASWHKQCHQKFNSSMLERAQQKARRKRKAEADVGELTSRPKRRRSAASLLCLFCGIALWRYCMTIWISLLKTWLGRCVIVRCL